MKKNYILSLLSGLLIIQIVMAQQTTDKVSLKALSATVEVVGRGETEVSETSDGIMHSVTVRITPSETTQKTAALCMQEGEMEGYYGAGYTPLEMFNLYDQAYTAQKGGSMFKEGTYDTVFYNLWDSCAFVIWVCCVSGSDTNIISQPIPSYNESSLSMIDVKCEIYPNPVAKQLNVVTSNNIEVAELVNSLGQTVYRRSLNSTHTSIDVSDFEKGVYFLRLKNNKNTILKKILIK